MGTAISPRGASRSIAFRSLREGTHHVFAEHNFIDKLVRLIGTPKCPALIDVRTDEDDSKPTRTLFPSAVHCASDKLEDWAERISADSLPS